ncbi:MAG: murein hydrolase activator EnvC family protein [Chromatiales bacterium]
MNHPARRACSLLIVAASLVSGPALGADDPQQELRELRTRISAAEGDKKQLEVDAEQAVTGLKQQELALARANERLAELEQTIVQKQIALQRLALRYQEHERNLQSERETLARLLRASYMMGRRDILKLLLSQEDPHSVSRLLTYHALIAHAHGERIAALTRDLTETRAFAEATRLERERLLALQSEQARGVQEVEALRMTRKKTLVALKGDLAVKSEQLKRLRATKRALEGLLQSLPGWSTSNATPEAKGLGSLKGRLPWPAQGRITRRFGEPVGKDSELTMRGVFIEAGPGSAVQAVGNGRVVFADWFQGFGLLLIIDHGGDYLSLYGHNQSFNKKTGEAVKTGEIIAAAGDSGGLGASGLYFELRHRGAPQDPAQWCR